MSNQKLLLTNLPSELISIITTHIPTIQEAYELKRTCKYLHSSVNRLLVSDSLAQIYERFYVGYHEFAPIGALRPILLNIKDEFHLAPVVHLKSTPVIKEDNERLGLEAPPELNWTLAFAIAGKCDWKSVYTKIIREDSSFETYFMGLRFSVLGTSAEIVKELLGMNPGILKKNFDDCWIAVGATEENPEVYEIYHHYHYRGDVHGYLLHIAGLHENVWAKRYLESSVVRDMKNQRITRRRIASDDDEEGYPLEVYDDIEPSLTELDAPAPVYPDIKDVNRAIELDALRRYRGFLEQGNFGSDMFLSHLQWASRNGAIRVVQYLVEEKGVDFHHNQEEASTWACEFGHFELVSFFLNHGSDIRIFSRFAMKYAAQFGLFKFFTSMDRRGVDYDRNSCFLEACEHGRTGVANYLVSMYRECFTQALLDEGLMMAASGRSQEKTIRYLVSLGADKYSCGGQILECDYFMFEKEDGGSSGSELHWDL
ncbi:hypothetical protein BJ742DRAFT_451774 [Cladochytrium replicatum]|nr:hypothetical protein BJ742DRAFT_451774 [Cladochytrium replicatum]